MSLFVPVVNLLDVDIEPSDEQLEALMYCVHDEATQKASIANTKMKSPTAKPER